MEVKTLGKQVERLRLRIIGQSCSTCIVPVRRVLERAIGVEWVGANPILDLIFVDYDPRLTDPAQILATVKRTGYEAVQAAT